MLLEPIIVLKLGGSVLRSELQMRSAVHEIYRWRREGWRVVAVVSALTGRTDELLEKCARLYKRRSPRTEASVAACGELESAALLGLHLGRAGVPASVLTPGTVQFVAQGPPLDAWPTSIEAAVLHEALERHGVVVFPGYVATSECGEPVVLGRGGSDLTALYLAHALAAKRCRLIKDVEGLFDRDPAQAGPSARLFASATYEDALATDGTILQHKAIEFARDHCVEFEVARFNGVAATRVGTAETTYSPAPVDLPPMRVALLGHGTVGEGVRELLDNLPGLVDVTDVAIRSIEKHASLHALDVSVHVDPERAVQSDVDVVVEVMGGVHEAASALTRAVAQGIHVVTANKSMLAEVGRDLHEQASSHGVQVQGSASVGAAMPIVEAIRNRPGAQVKSIRAVLNGTANFILNQVAVGHSFSNALVDAQSLGFAEFDPQRDLNGLDAADKLRVLAMELGLDPVAEQDIPCDVLSNNIESRFPSQDVFRQVATLNVQDARATCAVRIEELAPCDALADLTDEENAAIIEWRDGTRTSVRGAGAGRWPTAESVVADVLALERERRDAVDSQGALWESRKELSSRASYMSC